MFLGRKRVKHEPRERNLFREAFLPSKRQSIRRQEQTKPEAGRRVYGILALWSLFFLTVVYAAFFSSLHSITHVSVEGTHDVPPDQVRDVLRNRMEGRLFRVLPRDNFFLFSSEDAEQELLASFPKLRSVEIRRRFPDRVEVSVSERDRIPLWCSDGACFLLDDDGTARDSESAERSENEPFLVRIDDSSRDTVSLGDRILGKEALSRLLVLERNLRTSGIVAVLPRISIPSRAADEFRFSVTEGWDILVSADTDPETTMATLRVVLEKEIPEEKRTKLRYVDLRTEKKAFYSFIPDEPASAGDPGGDGDESSGKRDGNR